MPLINGIDVHEDDIFNCAFCGDNCIYGEEWEAINGELCCSESCADLHSIGKGE